MNEQPTPAESALDRTGNGEHAEPGRVPAETLEAADTAASRVSDTAPSDAVAELELQLRRALADLDNLRKRYQREFGRERVAERARVAADWLPVVDNLELALQHAGEDAVALIEGVRAVRDQAVAVLARLGFPRFDDVGQAFDPARHAAVSAIDSDAPPGTVVAALRPGYGTDETILRPAGVVVSRGSS